MPSVSNDIYGNGKLGIDLGNNGVTLDHSGGLLANEPNGYQNFPVLTLAAGTTVKGTLNGAAGTTYTIQVFVNPSAQTPAATAKAGGSSNRSPAMSPPTPPGTPALPRRLASTLSATGQFVTATATDPSGNTSEFSKALKAT